MAIKLMDVPGAKMLDDEKFTQDFILISHPAFFVNDLRIYKATLERFLRGSFWSQWASAPLQLRSLRAIAIAFRVNARFILNPLFIQYWSMTPYRLGIDPLRKLAVKYTAKPSQDVKKTVYDDLASYFARGFSLKKQMNDRLAMSEEARFDFYVQRYVDDRTPIEDATVAWSEAISKPEHVAQIVIPPQDIMSAARGDFCEHLSFNPWHGLPEHKPLGLVNRVRRRIYFEISEYRHGLNEVPRTEPTGNERFFSC
jgi:hypothetical protein